MGGKTKAFYFENPIEPTDFSEYELTVEIVSGGTILTTGGGGTMGWGEGEWAWITEDNGDFGLDGAADKYFNLGQPTNMSGNIPMGVYKGGNLLGIRITANATNNSGRVIDYVDLRKLELSGDPVVPATVTFNTNGGDTANVEVDTFEGQFLGLDWPAPPTLAGKVFVRWNTASNGSGTRFMPYTEVTGDIEVFAVWADEKADLVIDDPSEIRALFPANGIYTWGGSTAFQGTGPTIRCGQSGAGGGWFFNLPSGWEDFVRIEIHFDVNETYGAGGCYVKVGANVRDWYNPNLLVGLYPGAAPHEAELPVGTSYWALPLELAHPTNLTVGGQFNEGIGRPEFTITKIVLSQTGFSE